jgi:pyruvate/2-oxoacid:ferredoxin oxidoreductase alpha subunit
MYQAFQPEALRRRKDDVKTTCEFFVAYELTEATAISHDMEEYNREQSKQQQKEQEHGQMSSTSADVASNLVAKDTQI